MDKADDTGGGISAYPIGSIYMSVNPTNPADIFGGTWQALDQGRVLIGAGTAHPAGEEGGSETHLLSEEEMPAHTHTMDSAGSHTHGGSAGTAGAHTHSRGSMNIEGEITPTYDAGLVSTDYSGTINGAFEKGTAFSRTLNTVSGNSRALEFNASKDWTGSTSSNGEHSHSLSINSGGSHSHTINSKGGGEAYSIMQPYLSVYMWKRTA